MKGKPYEITRMLACLAGWTPAQVQAAFGRNPRGDQAHAAASAYPQGAQGVSQGKQKIPLTAATVQQERTKQPMSV